MSRSQWPRGLRRRSANTCLLRLWVWVPPGTWISVSCDCCVLSGRGLCYELITRPEVSYRLWCVIVWSRNFMDEEALAWVGLRGHEKKWWCLINDAVIMFNIVNFVIFCTDLPFVNSCTFVVKWVAVNNVLCWLKETKHRTLNHNIICKTVSSIYRLKVLHVSNFFRKAVIRHINRK